VPSALNFSDSGVRRNDKLSFNQRFLRRRALRAMIDLPGSAPASACRREVRQVIQSIELIFLRVSLAQSLLACKY
jgi:hypothetical protein